MISNEEVKTMSDDELRVKVAELCGWTEIAPSGVYNTLCGTYFGNTLRLPDYPSDLNAMHEAEKAIKEDSRKWFDYGRALRDVTGNDYYMKHYSSSHFMATFAHATARQRAEAFILTLAQ